MIYFESFLRERQVHINSIVKNLPSHMKLGKTKIDILVIASSLIGKLLVYCETKEILTSVDNEISQVLSKVYIDDITKEILMNTILQVAIKQYFEIQDTITIEIDLRPKFIAYIQGFGSDIQMAFSELDTLSIMYFIFANDTKISFSLSGVLSSIYSPLTEASIAIVNNAEFAQNIFNSIDENILAIGCSPLVAAMLVYRALGELDNLTLNELDTLTIEQADVVRL